MMIGLCSRTYQMDSIYNVGSAQNHLKFLIRRGRSS